MLLAVAVFVAKYLLILALKKRKRFHNDSCLTARRFFNEMLSKRFQLSLDSFVETKMIHMHSCVTFVMPRLGNILSTKMR